MSVRLLRRWDGDQRGEGVADGAWLADDVRRLLAALGEKNWGAEAPENHLLPHLQPLCDDATTPWTLVATDTVESVFVISLDWSGQPATMRRLRMDVFALLGAIAESVSYIHQRVGDEIIHYDVVSGMLDGDTAFHPHGHLIELHVSGVDVPVLCAGPQVISGAQGGIDTTQGGSLGDDRFDKSDQ